MGASPPSPGSLTGTGQQGVCREDALVDGESRSRVSTGGIGCGMRWERIGPTASVSVGLRWADRVASSGACAAKSARLPRVESGHGMYGVYLESLEDTTPGRNSGWSGWNRSARSRMNAS